jgi:hypothetical protein
VAALSKLVSLGSCSEAGLLGTSWIIVLRTLSQLERLQAQLMPGARPTMPFGNGGSSRKLNKAAAGSRRSADFKAIPFYVSTSCSLSFLGYMFEKINFLF